MPTYLFLRRLRRSPAAFSGLTLVILLVLTALFAPWLAPHDPNWQDAAARLQGPGAGHWLGTDSYGRDLLSRLLYGARPALGLVALDLAGIILAAAGLGFLGLGARPPMAEWGAMIADGMQVIFDQWWIAAIPGAAILLASLAFNLLGDGLRDILEPQHD